MFVGRSAYYTLVVYTYLSLRFYHTPVTDSGSGDSLHVYFLAFCSFAPRISTYDPTFIPVILFDCSASIPHIVGVTVRCSATFSDLLLRFGRCYPICPTFVPVRYLRCC